MKTITTKRCIKETKKILQDFFDRQKLSNIESVSIKDTEYANKHIHTLAKHITLDKYGTDTSIFSVCTGDLHFHCSILDVMKDRTDIKIEHLQSVVGVHWFLISFDGEQFIITLTEFVIDGMRTMYKKSIQKKEYVDGWQIYVYCSLKAFEAAKKMLFELIEFASPVLENVQKTVKDDEAIFYYLVPKMGGGYDLQDKVYSTKDIDMNMELQYGEGFNERYETMVDIIKSTTKGIAMFHGEPGTGKTYLIRYMKKDLKNKLIIYIPTNIASALGDPGFSKLISDKFERGNQHSKKYDNVLMVVEDAEGLTKERLNGGNVTDVILNFSDGIFNDIVPVQFLFTYNNQEKIDKAVLRSGRLLFDYGFNKLDVETAIKLARKIGVDENYIESEIIDECTVSDVYALKTKEKTDKLKSQKSVSKIGFIKS